MPSLQNVKICKITLFFANSPVFCKTLETPLCLVFELIEFAKKKTSFSKPKRGFAHSESNLQNILICKTKK